MADTPWKKVLHSWHSWFQDFGPFFFQMIIMFPIKFAWNKLFQILYDPVEIIWSPFSLIFENCSQILPVWDIFAILNWNVWKSHATRWVVFVSFFCGQVFETTLQRQLCWPLLLGLTRIECQCAEIWAWNLFCLPFCWIDAKICQCCSHVGLQCIECVSVALGLEVSNFVLGCPAHYLAAQSCGDFRECGKPRGQLLAGPGTCKKQLEVWWRMQRLMWDLSYLLALDVVLFGCLILGEHLNTRVSLWCFSKHEKMWPLGWRNEDRKIQERVTACVGQLSMVAVTGPAGYSSSFEDHLPIVGAGTIIADLDKKLEWQSQDAQGRQANKPKSRMLYSWVHHVSVLLY